MRTTILEQLAVIEDMKRIDEAHLADRDPSFDRPLSLLDILNRERVADANRFLHPLRNANLSKRSFVERLGRNGPSPDRSPWRLISTGEVRHVCDANQR